MSERPPTCPEGPFAGAIRVVAAAAAIGLSLAACANLTGLTGGSSSGDAGTVGSSEAGRDGGSHGTTHHEAGARDAAAPDARPHDATTAGRGPRESGPDGSLDAPRMESGRHDAGAPDAGAINYAATVMADHPLAYWRLGDPPDASTAADQTGSYPGVYEPGVTPGLRGAIADDPDTAAFFDSASIIVPGDTSAFSFVGLPPYSLEAWASLSYGDAGQDCWATILGRAGAGTNGPTDGWVFLNNCHSNLPGTSRYGADGSSAGSQSDSLVFRFGAWTHLVVTWDGTALATYYNGVVDSSSTGTGSPMTAIQSTLKIGGWTGGTPWYGALDEVAVYDHALSATQVCTHYKVGSLGPGHTCADGG